jgi:hypothetical protein
MKTSPPTVRTALVPIAAGAAAAVVVSFLAGPQQPRLYIPLGATLAPVTVRLATAAPVTVRVATTTPGTPRHAPTLAHRN